MSRPSPENQAAAAASDAEGPAADAVEAGALDEVVRATLESAESEERVTDEEIAALHEVARRLGPAPLVLDPVAIELLEAMILVNYGHLQRPPEVWRATAVKIATLLFESPAARARLENLWARLFESHGPDAANA